LLDELQTLPASLLILEQADLVMSRSPVAAALICQALDRGQMLLGVARAEYRHEPVALGCSLQRRTRIVPITDVTQVELQALMHAQLSAPTQVPISLNPQTLHAVLQHCHTEAVFSPGIAVDLADELLAYGEWKQSGAVGPDDAYYLAAEARRVAWESERRRDASAGESGSTD
jgi:hypothetical protein